MWILNSGMTDAYLTVAQLTDYRSLDNHPVFEEFRKKWWSDGRNWPRWPKTFPLRNMPPGYRVNAVPDGFTVGRMVCCTTDLSNLRIGAVGLIKAVNATDAYTTLPSVYASSMGEGEAAMFMDEAGAAMLAPANLLVLMGSPNGGTLMCAAHYGHFVPVDSEEEAAILILSCVGD